MAIFDELTKEITDTVFSEEMPENTADALLKDADQVLSDDFPEPLPEEDFSGGMPPLLEPPAEPQPEQETAGALSPPTPRRKGPRPERIMGIIAALSAALLLVMVILCIPYFEFGKDEDPETALRQQETPRNTQPPEVPLPEETSPTEETVKPTIPPDPNPYGRNDFQYNRYNYLLLQNVDSSPGVDVSSYQGVIDWQKVADSGIEFAIIRLGVRGYESGKLVEDTHARQNLTGAKDAGLKIGAYFFSQALSIEEAQEEIDFMLAILGEQYLDMPIILDWEIPDPNARTANMDARTLTDIQLHFCQRMEDLGYQPMVYFNWRQSEKLYYLHELEGAPFWLALYQDRMTFPWKVEMWQYTDRGRVPGIKGNVDLNVYMPD